MILAYVLVDKSNQPPLHVRKKAFNLITTGLTTLRYQAIALLICNNYVVTHVLPILMCS